MVRPIFLNHAYKDTLTPGNLSIYTKKTEDPLLHRLDRDIRGNH